MNKKYYLKNSCYHSDYYHIHYRPTISSSSKLLIRNPICHVDNITTFKIATEIFVSNEVRTIDFERINDRLRVQKCFVFTLKFTVIDG